MVLEIEEIKLKEDERINHREDDRTVWYVDVEKEKIYDIGGDYVERFNKTKIRSMLNEKKGLSYILPDSIFFVKVDGKYVESYGTYDFRKSIQDEILSMYMEIVNKEKERILNFAKSLVEIATKEFSLMETYPETKEEEENQEKLKKEIVEYCEQKFDKQITKFLKE